MVAKNRKVFDCVYCGIIVLLTIVISIIEYSEISLPAWTLTYLNLEEASYVIMEMQLAVAVLPLAIIALITGIMKDTAYGVPVMKYVMHMRPVILSYPRLSFAQIIISAISFCCMSFGWYNHLELCFFVTLSNTAIMMYDCFKLLTNYNKYEEEIRLFLTGNLSAENFRALSTEIINTKDHISEETLRKNLSVFNNMLLLGIKKTNLKEDLLSEYYNCFDSLFASKNSDTILLATESLGDLYGLLTQENIKINVFTGLQFEFYNGLKYTNLSDAMKRGSFRTLLFQLQGNGAHDKDGVLTMYATNVYNYAAIQNVHPLTNTADRQDFVAMIGKLFATYGEDTLSDRTARLNFIRSLIDHLDTESLDKMIFVSTDIHTDSDSADQFYAIQYLYYLAACEPLAEENQISFAKRYIETHQKYFSAIIHEFWFGDSNKDFGLLYQLMRNWEIIKLNCVKTLAFNTVVNDFLVFSLLPFTSWYSFDDNIGKIMEKKEFSIYSQYFDGEGAYKRTQEKYREFCDLFGFDYDQDSIETLKMHQAEIYKNSEMLKAIQEYAGLQSDRQFEILQQDFLNDIGTALSNHFSGKMTPGKSQHICIYDGPEYVFELMQKNNSRLQETIRNSVYLAVCRFIQKHIICQNTPKGTPIEPALSALKRQVNGAHIDTMIGGKHTYHYSERIIAKKWQDEHTAFLISNCNDCLFFVDSKKFAISIQNIRFHLQELSRDEIMHGRKPNEDGTYSYFITNKLEGFFTEDELVEYIKHKIVRLKIECDINCSWSKKPIGYGVIRK